MRGGNPFSGSKNTSRLFKCTISFRFLNNFLHGRNFCQWMLWNDDWSRTYFVKEFYKFGHFFFHLAKFWVPNLLSRKQYTINYLLNQNKSLGKKSTVLLSIIHKHNKNIKLQKMFICSRCTGYDFYAVISWSSISTNTSFPHYLQGLRAKEIWAPRMNNKIDNLGIY